MSTVQTTEVYQNLYLQIEALISTETDIIANLANVSAVIFNGLDNVNWAGFYILKGDTLVLGPFQGLPACIRIPVGKGVCGMAAETESVQLVKNVHDFDGHIACDSASNSEIVIPMFVNGTLYGVLDIDSPIVSRFDNVDKKGLINIVNIIEKRLSMTEAKQ